MDRLNLHTTLCHHIGSNGRIDTAGQQAHGSAAHTGGQATGTGFRRTMDISCQITNFHIDCVVRTMDIHLHIGMSLCQSTTDLLRELDGIQGEALVGALGLHLEGLGAIQLLAQIIFNRLKNGIHILFAGTAAAQTHHTENAPASFPCAIHIALLIHRLHIQSGLHQIHVEFAISLHTAANVLAQTAFKLALIGALQDDLAQL